MQTQTSHSWCVFFVFPRFCLKLNTVLYVLCGAIHVRCEQERPTTSRSGQTQYRSYSCFSLLIVWTWHAINYKSTHSGTPKIPHSVHEYCPRKTKVNSIIAFPFRSLTWNLYLSLRNGMRFNQINEEWSSYVYRHLEHKPRVCMLAAILIRPECVQDRRSQTPPNFKLNVRDFIQIFNLHIDSSAQCFVRSVSSSWPSSLLTSGVVFLRFGLLWSKI